MASRCGRGATAGCTTADSSTPEHRPRRAAQNASDRPVRRRRLPEAGCGRVGFAAATTCGSWQRVTWGQWRSWPGQNEAYTWCARWTAAGGHTWRSGYAVPTGVGSCGRGSSAAHSVETKGAFAPAPAVMRRRTHGGCAGVIMTLRGARQPGHWAPASGAAAWAQHRPRVQRATRRSR